MMESLSLLTERVPPATRASKGDCELQWHLTDAAVGRHSHTGPSPFEDSLILRYKEPRRAA